MTSTNTREGAAELRPLSKRCRYALNNNGGHLFSTVSHPRAPKRGEMFDYCEICHGYTPFIPRAVSRHG